MGRVDFLDSGVHRFDMKLANANAIIMVDDDTIDIRMMEKCAAASNLGNEFLAFTSGPDFLKYMVGVLEKRTPMPAIVFLDINMPRMNGFEVLEEIRSHDELNELPVIAMLTHSDSLDDVEAARALGAGFVQKFSSRAEAIEFLNGLA
jgi:CheY-like chemotaxis protein